MATELEMQELLGRALADEQFRARLFDDPQQAVLEAGYVLTAVQLAALKASDLQSIAENVDARLIKQAPPDG